MALPNSKRPLNSPAGKDSKKRKETDCLVCSKPTAKADVFECNWCEGLQHAECTNISKDQCEALSEVTSNVVFFCKTCLEALPVALKYFDNQALVESKITAVEKSVTEVQCSECKLHEAVHKVEAQFDHFQKSVESLLKEHKTTLTEITTVNNTNPGTQEAAQTNDSLSQLASTILSEQHEKERRQLNLIVHNIEESSSESPQSRKQEDIAKVTSLLKDHLKIKCSITNAIRLGKRTSDEKPRLLKIMVSSIDDKRSILKNKVQLRNESNPPQVKRIFITPDLTPLEQKKNKRLREELANLNKDGRKFIIKNGRIVQRGM